MIRCFFYELTPGSGVDGVEQQKAHEDIAEVDEREAEGEDDLPSFWAPKAIPVHYLVHQAPTHAR